MKRLIHISSTSLVMGLLLAFFAISCTPTVPKRYIQPDEMEDILYDYYVSQAMAGQMQSREQASLSKNIYYDAVLEKHGVTKADFDSSLVYYYLNSDKFYEIYTSLSDRISNDAMALGASVSEFNKFSQLDATGDTANIWREATSMLLLPFPPANRASFSIKADSTFQCGDSFMFNFMADFMYQAGTKDAIAYIAVHYDNDSTSVHVTNVRVSGVAQLRIPSNFKDKITSIEGFIYLNKGNDDSQTLKLMFISQIQFVRFHNEPPAPVVVKRDSSNIMGTDTLAVKGMPLQPIKNTHGKRMSVVEQNDRTR